MQRYESYKPSNAAWLDNVPSHWEVQPLRAVTSLKSDKNRPDLPVLSVYREYGVILKDSRDDNHNATSLDTSTYKVVKPGDLVVNKMKAWQGSMGVSAYDGIVSPAYITCTTKADRACPAYLHYLLRSSPLIGVYNSLSYGVRVGQWDMHYEDFKQILIPLPPKDEQDRIVAFLDQKTAEIDAAIAKKERLMELLIQQKDIQINHAVTCGLNPDVVFEDSHILYMKKKPKHWVIKKIKHISVISPSKTLDGRRRTSDSVCFLPMEKIGDDGTINSEERKANNNVFDGFTYFRKGDVVIAKITPCFENGKGAWLKDLPTDYGFGTTELHVVRPTKIHGEFLFRLLNRKIFRTEGEEFMVGSAGQKRVPTSFIANYLFACPPIEEQQEICMWISNLNEKVESLIKKERDAILRLRELKQVLIANTVTGRIKISGERNVQPNQ